MGNMLIIFIYLGHLINDKLNDKDDIKRQMMTIYARGNILKSRFTKCSKVVKLHLFKTLVTNLYTS